MPEQNPPLSAEGRSLSLPEGAELRSLGSFADGPLDPAEWETWLGPHAGWRNLDDMQDRRPGWGDLANAPNGLRLVVRPARPETKRLPRSVRQEAGDLLDAGAKGVCINCLHDKHEGRRARDGHGATDPDSPACFVAWNGVIAPASTSTSEQADEGSPHA